jgi:diadenosine tetraphosphate (Ap4A) HIT family hydrolase
VNDTIVKFGYPDTLIADYSSWVVLLRPQQATLGALVLASKEPVHAFGDVSAAGCEELARVTHDIERALRAVFSFDKINYLMLMMVDRDVHFHVIPRYAEPRSFEHIEFEDPGWPGPPRLDHAASTDTAINKRLVERLMEAW